MKTTEALTRGFTGALRSWRAVFVMWLISLIMTLLVAVPVKSTFKAALDNSMITEKFTGGIIAGVIPDLGTTYNSLLSSFSAGLFFLILVWFFMNVFLTGGIFGFLSSRNEDFSIASFFRKALENFGSFLVIMLVMNLVIIFVFILFFILPLVIAVNSDSVSEAGVYNTILISGLLTIMLVLVILLITDFARSWKATSSRGPFRSIAAGFRLGLRNLPSSFLFMLIIVLVQLIPSLAAYMIISSPAESQGVFALFISTQLLFFIKIALRIWRYAGITAIMERYQTQKSIPVRTEPLIINEKTENDFII